MTNLTQEFVFIWNSIKGMAAALYSEIGTISCWKSEVQVPVQPLHRHLCLDKLLNRSASVSL